MISSRMLQVLKTLKGKSEPVSGEEICFNLGITTRTLRNDLKREKDHLKDVGIEIVSIAGKGYFLEVFDEERYYQFLSSMLVDNQSTIPKDDEDHCII